MIGESALKTMFTQRHDELPRCENKCAESKTVLISESLFKTLDGQAPVREYIYIFFFMHKCLFELNSYLIFHSTEFQFVLAVGNRCSKRIVQLSLLSLCINLRKEQIDRSKGQTAYLFVNGRR